MQKTEHLLHGQFYHIYNCGINGEPLFREETNYEYFLGLYEKHITKIADTHAWCLMGNHFHFLVRIKNIEELVMNIPDRVSYPVRGNDEDTKQIKPVHLYFSHLFNSYTQAYNKMYSRHGSLFERPFKRKHIDNEKYLKQVVIYIHNNPVHHGFCNHPLEYAWSSYRTFCSEKPTKIRRDTVLEWFERKDNFDYAHQEHIFLNDIENYLGLV